MWWYNKANWESQIYAKILSTTTAAESDSDPECLEFLKNDTAMLSSNVCDQKIVCNKKLEENLFQSNEETNPFQE